MKAAIITHFFLSTVFVPGLVSAVLPPHYRVVTIPDGDDIVQNLPGADTPFSGPQVQFMDFLAQFGNFTYEISARADGNFGKKQADGKWNGMVGDLVAGKYDIILGVIAMTSERAEVLAASEMLLNATAYALINPSLPSPSPIYIIRRDLWKFMFRHSTEPKAQKIWQNIKANMPGSVVYSTDEAIDRVKAGNAVFISDEKTVERMVLQSGGLLAQHPEQIMTGVTVTTYATKKGSDVGKVLNAAFPAAFEAVVSAGEQHF